MFGARQSFLRKKSAEGHHRVTFVELFFDLVFVFAITQLSHGLLAHLTPLGTLETLLLFMAVWWVWIYTSWATNWLDPERMPVRLMLFALMFAGLVLSTSIPKAFESRGLAFALAYVAMQVGRSLFTIWCTRIHAVRNYFTFQLITLWMMLSAVFWIAGAFAEGPMRLGLWAVALAVEYAGPALAYWTPGLGRASVSDWDVEGSHMAERCGLFIIIALGESILVTGAKFSEMEWTAATIGAFTSAFVGSVAMWWIYFNIGAQRASTKISHASDPGRLARLSYTYLHLPIVAGIIITAVADELVLAHPGGSTSAGSMAVIIGGPTMYLFGNMLFKRSASSLYYPLSHIVGIALLTVFAPAYQVLTPLAFSTGTTLILIVVAIWETQSFAAPRTKPLKSTATPS